MLPNTEAEEQNGWRQEGARYVSTKRSTSSAASRGGLRGVDPRSIAVAGVLILSAALSLLLAGCTDEPRRLVMDDFESRELADWRTVSGGAGGWFVYTDGQKAPDPAHSDPNVPFDLPNPPQGTHAAVTGMNGPGTRILYRDVTLDGRLRLHEGVLRRRRLQQPGYPRVRRARRRISSSESTSCAARRRSTRSRRATCSSTSSKPRPAIRAASRPRSASTCRAGRARPYGCGSQASTTEALCAQEWTTSAAPIDSGADAGIELPDTPVASRALNLVLHRLTEADALTALSDRAAELAREGEFSGALLTWRVTERTCSARPGASRTAR